MVFAGIGLLVTVRMFLNIMKVDSPRFYSQFKCKVLLYTTIIALGFAY